MAGIIIYKGKYGATEQYSAWLAQELNLPHYEAGTENPEILKYCSFVVLGTSVYVGTFQLAKWIRKHQPALQGKKIFLFVVCGTPASEKDKLDPLIQKNIPSALLKNTKVFFLMGRMTKSRLSLFDRIILRMGASMVSDPAEKERMLADFDEVRKENLQDLIRSVKDFMPADSVKKSIVTP